MKKTLLLLIIITTLVLSNAQAFTSIPIISDSTSQLKHIPYSDLVAYSSDDETILYYGENGYQQTITNNGAFNAKNFINKAITEEGTNSLYYYNRSNDYIIEVHYNGTITTKDLSAFTSINERLIAVTPDYYVVGHTPSGSEGKTPISVYDRTTLALVNHINFSTSAINNAFSCDDTWAGGYISTCYDAIYDPNNNNIYVFRGSYGPGILQYFSFVKIQQNGTGMFINWSYRSGTLAGTTQGVNIGVYEYNDVCNTWTHPSDNHVKITCNRGAYTAVVANPYEVTADITAETMTYTSMSDVMTAYHDNDNGFLYVDQTTKNLYLGVTSNTDTTYGIDPSISDVVYQGDLFNPLLTIGADTLGNSHYKKIGDLILYVNTSGNTQGISIEGVYESIFWPYAKKYQDARLWRDDYWTGGNMLARVGNGIVNPWSVNPADYSGTQTYFSQAGTDGYYQYISGLYEETGSVETLQIMLAVDNPNNMTFYQGTLCNARQAETLVLERWDDEDAINDSWNINTGWGYWTTGSGYPLSEYDDDVAESESTTYLLFDEDATITMDVQGDKDTSIVTSINVENNATVTVTLADRYGDAITYAEIKLDEDTDAYTYTVDGEIIDSDSAGTEAGKSHIVVLSPHATKTTYQADLEKGVVAQTNNKDVRKIIIEVETTTGEASIGTIGVYKEPVLPIVSQASYVTNDSLNYTYHELECTYAQNGIYTVQHYASHVADDYDNMVEWEYDLNADWIEAELINNGTTGSIVTDEEQKAKIQNEVCDTLGVCTSNGRLLFAVIIMVAVLIAIMQTMSEKYHQTTATQVIPFLAFAVMFIVFAIFGFFPTTFVILGAIACAVVIATKFSFFSMGGSDRGGA